MTSSQTIAVHPEPFGPWPDAYRLDNGLVELVVVPAIGRIVSYHLKGVRSTNPIWIDTNADSYPIRGWVNYGGDKLWPSCQDEWGLRGTAEPDWPPCPAIDRGPYTAHIIDNGIVLTGPLSPFFAVTASRCITLKPDAPNVVIEESFKKSTDASADKDGFPIALWNITQIRGDAVAYLPIEPLSRFGVQGYITLSGLAKKETNWQRHGDLLEVVCQKSHGTKVGADGSAGWIAALFDGDVLFSEHCPVDPTGRYLDCGTIQQVWTNHDPAYIELELQGPGVDLSAGQSMTRTVTWRLEKLPRTPTDPVDARSMVSTVMHRCRAERP